MSKSLLLVGSNDRAALETIRSLGRHKVLLDTVYFEKPSLAERSRFHNTAYYWGNPFENYGLFLAQFKSHVSQKKYDLVVPINDLANEIIISERSFIEQYSTIAAPADEQYEFAHDKIKTGQLCKQVGVPFPSTKVISKRELDYEPDIQFPIYAKPQYSSLLDGAVFHNFQVKKINSHSQLRAFLRDNANNCDIMLQEKIGGHGVGMNIAAQNGEIIAFAITERLHEPPGGGNSSYRRSASLDEKLEGYARKLVAELKWTGVAMLEFKYDGNDYYLMEINPRLWGSVGLSIHSGVDFPVLLYNLFQDQALETKVDYKTGKYTRNLTRDVHWSLRAMAKGKVLKVLQSWLTGAFRMLAGKEKIDEFDWKDTGPFFASLGHITRRYGKSLVKRRKSVVTERPALKEIQEHDYLLFICKGNINRSAFAKEFLEQRHQIKSDSAGTLLKRNRFCSEQAEITAKEHFQVNMISHRSRTVFDLDLSKYSQIIVFDDLNYTFMNRHFSEYKDRLVYLSDNGQIKDPYKKTDDYFFTTFRKIGDAISEKIVVSRQEN